MKYFITTDSWWGGSTKCIYVTNDTITKGSWYDADHAPDGATSYYVTHGLSRHITKADLDAIKDGAVREIHSEEELFMELL